MIFNNILMIFGYFYKYTRATYDWFSGPVCEGSDPHTS